MQPLDLRALPRATPAAGRLLRWLAIGTTAATLVACSAADPDTRYPRSSPGGGATYEERDSVFGPGGLTFLGGGDEQPGESGGTGLGVNAFLWRATLDTLSFMPLASADPFGGVIITEWYSPQSSPDERFKVNIFILGRELRADGVRAALFRQMRDETGAWRDAPTSEESNTEIEDAILTRARELRIAQAG